MTPCIAKSRWENLWFTSCLPKVVDSSELQNMQAGIIRHTIVSCTTPVRSCRMLDLSSTLSQRAKRQLTKATMMARYSSVPAVLSSSTRKPYLNLARFYGGSKEYKIHAVLMLQTFKQFSALVTIMCPSEEYIHTALRSWITSIFTSSLSLVNPRN